MLDHKQVQGFLSNTKPLLGCACIGCLQPQLVEAITRAVSVSFLCGKFNGMLPISPFDVHSHTLIEKQHNIQLCAFGAYVQI
jgi:hypothetical protein